MLPIDSVLHGDSEEILSQVPDEIADLYVTDPPYGMEYKSNRQGVDRHISVEQDKSVVVRASYFEQIANDHLVPILWLKDAYRTLKDGGAMYIFCHWSQWGFLASEVEKVGFTIKNMIVMNKSNHGMGDKFSYAPKHELLLFATKGRHKIIFPNKRDNNVWDVPVKFSGSKRLHPNEKPLIWFYKPILNSSKEGNLIVDPFCGSGSSLIVAKRFGRKFLGIELDPIYHQIAEQRLREENSNTVADMFPD